MQDMFRNFDTQHTSKEATKELTRKSTWSLDECL